MALLESPNWETITPDLRSLLNWIGLQKFSKRFYLAGETALALQLGHRRSIDLDFFSDSDEIHSRTREEIIHVFSGRHSQIIENVDGNLLMLVDGLHIGFFSYGYPLLAPFRIIENVKVASILDIGLMKLDAIIGRGARKDFYDLYYIIRLIPLKDLLDSGNRKYPLSRDFPLMAVEGLLQFANADHDVQPELLTNLPWENVKQFFIAEAKTLGKEWFKK